MENQTWYGAGNMKRQISIALALSAFAIVSACGVRGDLERPPPLFTATPPEQALTPIDTPVEYQVAEVDENLTYLNSFGGEIPKPSPDADVYEESMGDFEPG